MGRRNSDSGRQAVIWLATVFVIAIGAAASAFVVIAGANEPRGPLAIIAVCFSVLFLTLMLASIPWGDSASQLRFWLSAQNRSNPTDDYRAARRRIESREEFGTNQPPTVETIKDAANDLGTWVPRSSVPDRHRKHS